MLRRLDRYILAEILGPLALGFLIFTFIFLINVLFKSAELIIRTQVPTATVGKLLLVSLPSIIVLTIPMALLFSILIAVGRLSSDSELTAIRSCGISLFSLYRPILVLSAVLTAFCVFLMLEVLPEGNRALQQLRVELVTRSLTQEIEPRVPYTAWQNKVLYIFEAPPDGSRWHGVFLADAIPSVTESHVIVAQSGQAEALDDGDRILLTLEDACNHQVDFTKPIRYELGCHEDSYFVLETQQSSARAAATSVKRSLREMTFAELREQAASDDVDRATRYLATVEIHKKFSIPATCLVFGLLALPLGFSNARGGRSTGFALSLGVILVYYVLLSWGEELARNGSVPAAISVWIANVFYLVIGLFLLARRNSDKSLILSRLDHWIQERAWGRLLYLRQNREIHRQARKERAAASRVQRKANRADLVLRLPQVRLRFPNATDRYVLAAYFKVLVVVAFACLTIYIVADLTERVDEILKYGISRDVVIRYYQFKCFAILYQIAPIIVLATTLVTFGLLSRTNEITAFKAAGISLFRLALPVVLASLTLAAFVGWLQAEILPAASSQVAELEAVIRNQPMPHRFQRADRRWLYGRGENDDTHYLYNYLSFDEEEQALSRLQVFKFDANYRLINRLLANRASYAGDGWWTFTDGWVRTFAGSSVSSFRRFEEPVRDHLPEDPDYFRGDVRLPREMSYRELRSYLEDLRQVGGQEVPLLEVELHNKIAYPAITVVMALVALPFAFRLGRRGALYGIGLSLVLGIVLMVFLAIFSALGQAAILPPLVAVWSPSILFSIFSLYLFLGVRT